MALPFTAKVVGPGPRIATLFVTSNSPLVSVMVPVMEKLMMSPFATLVRALRSVPAPLSAVLVTVSVAAWVEPVMATRTAARVALKKGIVGFLI